MDHKLSLNDLEAICAEVRKGIFTTCFNAGSGHMGGSSSSVELMVALYFGGLLKFDPSNPRHPIRDRVLVRGHLGPLRYNMFNLIGLVNDEELSTYRQLGSRLQGHEVMELIPGIDITPSGSLGQLLSYGIGAALIAKKLDLPYKVYVFLGDGEEQEGNVSEAARHGATLELDNLVCILDNNKKQLSGATFRVDKSTNIAKMWNGYGWDIKHIKDGHNLREILAVFAELEFIREPTFVIANTIKGKGLPGNEEHFCGYHNYSTCPKEVILVAIKQQEKQAIFSKETLKLKLKDYVTLHQPALKDDTFTLEFKLKLEQKHETLFDVVADYASIVSNMVDDTSTRFYVLTADMIGADDLELYDLRSNTTFIDVGIREQHLLALAHGISVTDKNSRILISYYDPFIYRASDQLNAIAQSGSRMIIVGSDSGLSGARNGSTHQSSGQAGMLCTMPGLTFLEPADALDLINCFNWSFTYYSSPVYIRMHNAPLKPLNVPFMKRNLSYYVVSEEIKPDVILVASGFPVINAVEAADKLSERNIRTKVINILNPKSLDENFVNMLKHNIPVLTLYNGAPDILVSEVARAVMQYRTITPSTIQGHGFNFGTSGSFADLVQHYKLDADGIIETLEAKFQLRGGI